MEPAIQRIQFGDAFTQFRKGMIRGLPIFLGYVPAAVAFGVLGTTTGLSTYQTAAMSVFVYAGASQFMALNLIQNGVNISEIIFATFILNLRHLLMSTVLSQRVTGGRKIKSILAFGITDETFVISTVGANGRDECASGRGMTAAHFAGVAVAAYSGWVGGTVLGMVFANILPPVVMKGMGISLYAMFIALLVPSLKRSGKVALVAVLSAAMNWVLAVELKLSGGWAIVASTMLASAAGALIYREGSK